MKIVPDTNIFLHSLETLNNYNNLIYLSSINRELESHKAKNGEISFLARRATRYIEENIHKFKFDISDYEVDINDLDPTYVDNQILASCIKNNYALLTNDLMLRHKAKCYGVKVVESTQNDINNQFYKGYKFVDVSDEELAYFYENLNENIYNLNINQYLIIRDKNKKTIDKYRWDGERHVGLTLPPKKFIKPKNDLQECVLDLLMNKDIPIKFIAGTTGSGKTYLTTRMGLFHVKERGNHAKIMIVRNPIGSGEEIGYLKGDKHDKTEGFFNSIIQHLDQGELEAMAMEQRGELVREIPFYMKGLSISDAFIIVDESEDMKPRLIKMLGSRPSTNSVIVFTGDWNQAEDKYTYDNGLLAAINHFKDHPLVGTVVMDLDVRSDVSRAFADWDI